jgi:transcriptional antiterminator NusG
MRTGGIALQWYALFVKTGEEETMRSFLNIICQEDRLEVLIPKRMLQERRGGKTYIKTKVLFPGYVLIRTEMDYNLYYRLCQIPNVYTVIKNEQEPVPIPEEEMAPILALTRYGEVIDFSKVYREGREVRVISGPLKGLEGLIEKFDHRKKRVKISLDFMGEKRTVYIGAEDVSVDHLVKQTEKEPCDILPDSSLHI